MISTEINQLTAMYTTRGERRLISIMWQKECVQSKRGGQTNSRSIVIVHTCRSCKISTPSPQHIVVIDNFDLHIFQSEIDFVIFDIFLRFKFSQHLRHRFVYQWLDNFKPSSIKKGCYTCQWLDNADMYIHVCKI